MMAIVEQILQGLRIPYTKEYLKNMVDIHPFKHSLYAISTVLNSYGIKTDSVRLSQKKEITEIPLPAVVLWDNRFAIIQKVTTDVITLRTAENKTIIAPFADFIEKWNGVVMLIENTENAAEPDHKANLHRERLSKTKNFGIIACASIFAIIAFISTPLHGSWAWWLLIVSNIAGLFITTLLLQKQLHINTSLTDSICGLIHQKDCDTVTESDGGTLLGMVKLSEVGFSFFAVNLLTLMFFPRVLFWMSVINLVVLPFTFWSVWYQKFKVRSWCALCLMTLCIMWISGIIVLAGGFLSFPSGEIVGCISIVCGYVLATLLINRLMKILADSREKIDWHQRYNALKMNSKVMGMFMNDTTSSDTSKEACSSLIFGNPEAERSITVFSNPYCGPCAKMHERIEKFPGKDLNISYVLTYFSEEKSEINKLIIAAYFQLGPDKTWKLLTEWYAGGKKNGADFFKNRGLNPEAIEVVNEFEKQQKWNADNNMQGTPTVIYNGKVIPSPYTPEDYLYLPL